MEEESSKKIPSNEEIIDELTKNLEESYLKLDDESKSLKDEEDNKSSIDKTNDTVKEDENNIEDKLDDCKTNNDESNMGDPYYVDELELKDRDVTLSESEKEACKVEAEKLKLEGNSLFKEGNYEEATDKYTLALRTLPLEYSKERAILYANRAAATVKFMTEKEKAISDCTKAIELDPNYVKAYLRRAHLYEESDKLNEALEDFKKILTFDPSHTEARCATVRLPPEIEKQNEKLKAECLDKLKDLGNLILRPFGLSTNNFELQKDPNSGGYSVKFNQNPT